MANPTKKRIFYFDELRALAILMVVLCHTCVKYKPFVFESFKLAIPGSLYVLTHIAVPIFFMLSGALLLNRTYSLGDFFKKRFSRLLYPFIFWVIVAVFVSLFVLHNSFVDVSNILTGTDRWTWFVWVMIGVYLILPVINSFIKEYQLQGAKYFLVIWFVTIVLGTFNKFPFYNLELSYFARFIGYTVLGYYLANADFRLSDLKMAILGFVMFVVFIAIDIGLVAFDVSSVETKYLSMFVVLSAVGFFLMFRYFVSYCENNPTSSCARIHSKIENGKIGKIIFSLSACSYGMYLVNSIVYKFIHTTTSVKLLPIIFIGVLLISWAAVFVVSKIPFLSKFSGTA